MKGTEVVQQIHGHSKRKRDGTVHYYHSPDDTFCWRRRQVFVSALQTASNDEWPGESIKHLSSFMPTKHCQPKPPHSHIFGHLITMGELVSTLPPDLHPHSFPHHLRKKYPDLGPVFYLDNWPVSYPICAVVDPDVAYQATQQNSLPKHEINKEYIEPFVGKYNMLTLEGNLWKQWRSIFNPSFASGHVIHLVPRIIEDTSIFCDTLSMHAEKSDIFSLEDVTTKLTIDVIGRVVM